MPVSAPAVRPSPEPGFADPGFGIYMHWPFCRAICPYCDFNVHRRKDVDQARWRQALVRELEHFAERAPGRAATSIYFGGGTPSLMVPETVAAVIACARRHTGLVPDTEVTLEANPSSTDAGRFAEFRAAGVTRLSLGVQALDDAALTALGRDHDAAEARRALAVAADVFPAMSFDLIYARPGQTTQAWGCELDSALALARGHLSLYQLTIEPGTAFHRAARRGTLDLPGDDAGATFYALAQERCTAAGLSAYEISNHAAPGHEGRHNLTCWRYGEYLGIGPGAHGRFAVGSERHYARQLQQPEAWLDAVESRDHGTEASGPIDRAARATEMLLMGLRLAEGVSLARFEAVVGTPFAAIVPARALEPLVEGGLVTLDERRLRATGQGRRLLDGLIERLLGAMDLPASSPAAGTLTAGSIRPGSRAM